MTKNTVKQGYETSEITRQHIIETAEKMFLEQGIDAVSDRAILREAGQRNLSALKYHFGGRDGLISAIRERRDLQTETRRREILEQVIALALMQLKRVVPDETYRTQETCGTGFPAAIS